MTIIPENTVITADKLIEEGVTEQAHKTAIETSTGWHLLQLWTLLLLRRKKQEGAEVEDDEVEQEADEATEEEEEDVDEEEG